MSVSSIKSSHPRVCAWLRLTGCALALWGFFGFVGPWLVSSIPAWRSYCDVQEAHGLDSGALYYTDVPVSLECERANRAAVEHALALRREKAAL